MKYSSHKAKHQYYTEFVDENSSDQSRLFRASKKLLGYNDSPLFTHYGDKSLVVNETGKFFARKIVKIRDQIDARLFQPLSQYLMILLWMKHIYFPSSSRCPRVMC